MQYHPNIGMPAFCCLRAVAGSLIHPLQLAVLLILLGATYRTAAQQFSIRPAFGAEGGALLSIRRDPGVINHTGSDGLGRSQDLTYWLGAEIESGRSQNELWSGVLRFGIGFSNGRFLSTPYESYATVHRGTQSPVKSMLELEVTSTQTSLHCDALALLHPIPNAFILAGPWVRYRASSATIETERALGTTDAVFPGTSTSERTLGAGKGIESFPFRGGLFVGLGYDFTLFNTVTLRPIIGTRCDAEAVLLGLGRRAFGFEASASFAIDFTTDNTPRQNIVALPIDTMSVLAAMSNIDAAVDLFNLDTSSGTRDLAIIKSQRTVHRQYVPVAPVIFFDIGTDTIPARYNLAQSSEEAYAEVRKTRMEPLDAHRDLLNILGKRLNEDTRIVITLRSELAPNESDALGRRRSDRIREYLHSIWSIHESRIKIESPRIAPSRSGGSPAVIITSSEPVLMTPTVSQWIVDDHTLPHIGLTKKIDSRLGIKEWKVTIIQSGRHIAQLSHDDFGGEINATLPLSPLTVDSTSTPLMAELTVRDYNGFNKTVSDTLELKLMHDSEEASREIRIYYFFEPQAGFPGSSIANKALIEKIATTTRNGARINITSGSLPPEGKWNGAVVAQELLSVLQARSIHISEMHLERTITSTKTSSPDEKLIDRAVRVTVEQSIPQEEEHERE